MKDTLWYLSPSNQDGNIGVNGYGSEAEQMCALANEVAAHLDRCHIPCVVARFEDNLETRVYQANNYCLASNYLALHSNASGDGSANGVVAYYYKEGWEMAREFAHAILELGQKSNRASNVAFGEYYETRMPKAPACILEVDFHDNPDGVAFITTKRNEIAEAIAKTICKISEVEWVEEFPENLDYPEDNLYEVLLPQLVKGDYCGYVRTLQVLLNATGCGHLALDAEFGDCTETVVKRFQKSVGLAARGVVNQATWEELLK